MPSKLFLIPIPIAEDGFHEREKMSVSKSIDFIGRHKGLAIGNGIVFYLLHCVLIVGWVLAPAYAVIAATISMYEVSENRKVD